MTSKNENLNSINWSLIPALVIEKICKYLDMSDKRSMSLVCKNWWEDILPKLWKYFKLSLGGHSLMAETLTKLELAYKYGCMFRHVRIMTIGYLENASKLCMQLEMFFEAISSKTHLVSFELNLIELHHSILKLTGTEYVKKFRCILNFIRTQYELENVSLKSIFLDHEDGMELLNTLCNNCHNLKTLHLDEFLKRSMNYSTNPNSHQIYQNLALKFINLQKLVIDYSKIFENIFSSFQELAYDTRLPRRLLEIEVRYNGINMSYCEGIPAIAWKVLHKLCPDLKLNAIISYPIFNSLEMYLVQFMPVTKLYIIGLNDFFQLDLEHLFQRIISTEIVNHIECVYIFWLSQADDISICLIPFFNACLKLFVFDITIMNEAKAIEELFQFILNNRNPNLKCLIIHILSINEEDQRRFISLSEEYCPLFEARGLKLFFDLST